MDKRALSAIPRPALTDKNKEMPLLVSNMCYLATASRQEIGGNDTLIINFFRKEEKKLNPAFRTFCQMDDYITQDLSTDRTKWKTGAIDYLTGYLYWHRNSGNIVIASVAEREVILSFLQDFRRTHGIDDQQRAIPHGAVVDSEVENRIDEYQGVIKEWKLQARHKKEKAEIDQHMEKFGELPADYEQFVKETVFSSENYIFYSRPKERAYCSKCGHDFELRRDGLYHKKIAIWNDTDQVKHNRTVRCPYCNSFLMCKSEGMGRQSLFAIQWSVLVQKYGDEVLVRYFCHTKDFRIDFRNPRIESSERFRTVHTVEKSIDFEWCRFKSTQDLRWCYLTNKSYGCCQPSEMNVPRSTVLYNTDLLETVAGTCMKYSAVDIYIDKVVQNDQFLNKPWCIDWYFNSYRENPYLEQFLKIGFYKLTQAVLKDYDCPKFKNGRTILETLQVSKLQFNMLRGIGDPSVRDVRILQYAKEIRQEDFDILRYVHDDEYDRMYEKYLDMRRYTTVYKLKKYIDKQRIFHDRDYFDYIRWLEEMGYDMRNEFNLYPKDFKKAHDDKSKEYTRFKDKQAKEDEKRFKRLLAKLRKETEDVDAMDLKTYGMFIRLPKELDELKREGETLHHCVGTYRDRVAKGDTMIFFIRLESDPDQPFYTLEWKGRVIQCRGFKNCDMTPEVKAFVNIFQEKMMEYEEKPLKRRKVG
ncbi:PcfJ domain-containing protein [uncultured Acetatifactor sp.]|uniref:PcfJ domain-containing protein n=1 Tax=uncultured Acetatifactor sp. TaxID=1671927 RepID=UPI002605FCEE|nr:PcfJ domain-containing protein [uncultured Acetatifactor sp.]